MKTQSALPKYRSAALDAIEGSDAAIRSEYEKQDAWGILTSIDLHGCDGALIRNAEEVKRHVHELCEHIGMKRFGETVVVHFGEDKKVAGFSMTQLIETSLNLRALRQPKQRRIFGRLLLQVLQSS